MPDASAPIEKRMRLRYAGVCSDCGCQLEARAEALYDRARRTVRCVAHERQAPDEQESAELPPVDVGTPGASARREFERRADSRERRIRAAHPKLGGLIHALSDDPQSTRAWDVGAVGEERLGNRLNELSGDLLRVLHDRRVPGSRANIDHLAVTPTGVHVIDAKKYDGRPTLKVEGGLLRPRVEKLLVGGRDRTKLVDGVLGQVDLVRSIVGPTVPVRGVLCFVEADWPLIGGAFATRGVAVMWPKRLYPQLQETGPRDGRSIDVLHRQLATALPWA